MRGPSTNADPTLDALLDEVYGLAEDDPEAALTMLDDASETWPDQPELLFARGELEWTLHGPEAAEPHYRRAVALAPTFADARYALGEILGLLGEEQAMIVENLEVRRLDTEADLGEGVGAPEDQRFIAQVAEEVLAAIPEEFRARLGARASLPRSQPRVTRGRGAPCPARRGRRSGRSRGT